MATRTLAPVTSVRPEDWTWIAARWITRWKAAVGTASDPSISVTRVREVVVDEIVERLAELIEIDRTGLHHLRGIRLVDQRQKQMFQRREFMPARIGYRQRRMDRILERLGKRWHAHKLLSQGSEGAEGPSRPWPHSVRVRLDFRTFKPFLVARPHIFGPAFTLLRKTREIVARSERILATPDFAEDLGVASSGHI